MQKKIFVRLFFFKKNLYFRLPDWNDLCYDSSSKT